MCLFGVELCEHHIRGLTDSPLQSWLLKFETKDQRHKVSKKERQSNCRDKNRNGENLQKSQSKSNVNFIVSWDWPIQKDPTSVKVR